MNQNPEHLFIVRIWLETSSEAEPAWRGAVEHIPTGERQYFIDLSSLMDFIKLRLDEKIGDLVIGV